MLTYNCRVDTVPKVKTFVYKAYYCGIFNFVYTSILLTSTFHRSKWSSCFCARLTGWEEERVSSPSILRLIFQGRFLHGNVTLGGKTESQRKNQDFL